MYYCVHCSCAAASRGNRSQLVSHTKAKVPLLRRLWARPISPPPPLVPLLPKIRCHRSALDSDLSHVFRVSPPCELYIASLPTCGRERVHRLFNSGVEHWHPKRNHVLVPWVHLRPARPGLALRVQSVLPSLARNGGTSRREDSK